MPPLVSVIELLCAVLLDELFPYRDQFVDNASTFFGSVERYLALGTCPTSSKPRAWTAPACGPSSAT